MLSPPFPLSGGWKAETLGSHVGPHTVGRNLKGEGTRRQQKLGSQHWRAELACQLRLLCEREINLLRPLVFGWGRGGLVLFLFICFC